MKTVYFAHDRQEDPADRTSYLQLTGYQVTLFQDSASLLQACEQAAPDLVLLDSLLPGLNGFDTARLVRERLGPSVPMVLCSGIYKSEEYRTAAQQAGCDGYLLLPTEMGEFLACMQSVAESARARTEAEAAAAEGDVTEQAA